jgi:hypothetical protein
MVHRLRGRPALPPPDQGPASRFFLTRPRALGRVEGGLSRWGCSAILSMGDTPCLSALANTGIEDAPREAWMRLGWA